MSMHRNIESFDATRPVRIIIFGNASSGKTTMARKLASGSDIPVLSLDAIAWQDGPARRPLHESIDALKRFIATHESWILEGCYGDLVEAARPHCTELRWLNPGIEACVANCRRRPWEPDKFASPEEQDRMLRSLIAWVRQYESRDDDFGLQRHRAIFDLHDGPKRVYEWAELSNAARNA